MAQPNAIVPTAVGLAALDSVIQYGGTVETVLGKQINGVIAKKINPLAYSVVSSTSEKLPATLQENLVIQTANESNARLSPVTSMLGLSPVTAQNGFHLQTKWHIKGNYVEVDHFQEGLLKQVSSFSAKTVKDYLKKIETQKPTSTTPTKDFLTALSWAMNNIYTRLIYEPLHIMFDVLEPLKNPNFYNGKFMGANVSSHEMVMPFIKEIQITGNSAQDNTVRLQELIFDTEKHFDLFDLGRSGSNIAICGSNAKIKLMRGMSVSVTSNDKFALSNPMVQGFDFSMENFTGSTDEIKYNRFMDIRGWSDYILFIGGWGGDNSIVKAQVPNNRNGESGFTTKIDGATAILTGRSDDLAVNNRTSQVGVLTALCPRLKAPHNIMAVKVK